MKELKAQLAHIAHGALAGLWNPVKELKVNLLYYASQGVAEDLWNPVKELKEIES